jgi:REP element-mobilizing transposase RayT
MARALRIQFENALYHVTSRGNERRDIVRDDRDRAKCIEYLARKTLAGAIEGIRVCLAMSVDG